ncbi:hypothetical protein PUN28_010900 [Cardiocondyla obscurior]|uniref:Uncharacterized protein n=1 Tax=Cardiocondyla obscurior TaxID=286306 RepID=A0AAW2FMR8_9HYME
MHLGLFELIIFIRSRDMAKKQKIFLKFYNHCAALKIDEFGPIWSHLFSSEAEIWPKTKNIFEILQPLCGIQNMHSGLLSLLFSSEAEIWPKTKKIFLKFNNIALCIQNRCIWAYSSFYFHQKPRYGQKTKKIFLKFYNVALCIWAYSELLFSSEAEIWPKNKKKYF